MNLQRQLFGRLTINGKRYDLGYTTMSQLLLRLAQVYSAHRSSSQELIVTFEASGTKLPDSSVLNREQMLEQSLAASIVNDPNEESPFEGISMGRVQEVMLSPEYEAWAYYCLPANREGITHDLIEFAQIAYRDKFPDCAPHFPKYIES
jgi:hypothetical protein